MKLVLLLSLGIFSLPFIVDAQNDKPEKHNSTFYISPEFNLNSVSLVGLETDDSLNNILINKIGNFKGSDKYVMNPIQLNPLKQNINPSENSNFEHPLNKDVLIELLNNNKVGQQILSTWFNRQVDSSFNFQILDNRGLKNIDINDLIQASKTKKGKRQLNEMGLNLINQSYVIIFDLKNISTLEQYYDKARVSEENRIMNGLIGSFHSYILKLDFNNSVAATFLQEHWHSANDPDRVAKITDFENTEFPFFLLKNLHFESSATQHNPGQPLAPRIQMTKGELTDRMIDLAIEKVLSDVVNLKPVSDFNTLVNGTNPITGKMGKKEGLKFGHRYSVYENRIGRNNKIHPKRIAVVKPVKIVDNRDTTRKQINSSAFYQIAGKKVDADGMYLKKYKGTGINLFVGGSTDGILTKLGRVEYYFSRAMNDMVLPGKTAKGMTAIKVYAEGGTKDATYQINGTSENFLFRRGSIGIGKDYYPVRFMHWGPFLGYGLESAINKNSENVLSTNFVELGLRFGINLFHNIQFVASSNFYILFNSILLNEKKDVIMENYDYIGSFKDREGPDFTFGLRIML